MIRTQRKACLAPRTCQLKEGLRKVLSMTLKVPVWLQRRNYVKCVSNLAQGSLVWNRAIVNALPDEPIIPGRPQVNNDEAS